MFGLQTWHLTGIQIDLINQFHPKGGGAVRSNEMKGQIQQVFTNPKKQT